MARLTVKSHNPAGDIEMMTFTTCSLLTLHLNHYIHYILELGLVFSRSETFVFIVGVAMGVFFKDNRIGWEYLTLIFSFNYV